MVKRLFKSPLFVLAFVILLGVMHPISRPAVLFLLPIGSGPDDLIIICLCVLFVFVWSNINKGDNKDG